METPTPRRLLSSLPPLLLLLAHLATPLPLSTDTSHIVDSATGRRVKLRCVNWAAHMPSVIAEGLDRSPLPTTAALAASLGFNCVRLTYATRLFTRQEYDNLTVAASLAAQGLGAAAEGVARNNPDLAGMTVRDVYGEVVAAIGDAGMMVVLDNHVSKPQWCCGADDGNGFFGDSFFDVDEWLLGLETVARRFTDYPQVVGMSMRNELRGPNQTTTAWYRNVGLGATRIHAANPDVLVIISGLSFGTDLSFLAHRPIKVHFTHKLVLEAHWYSFSDRPRSQWANGPPSKICSDSARRFDERAGFVSSGVNGSAAVPLFISEFGVDQRGINRGDNRFLSCFLAFAAERDLDWAIWTLQGSYYMRNGQAGFEETYGVLDAQWAQPKNPNFKQRFALIQEMLQDPGSDTEMYQVMYHPQSGRCVGADDNANASLVDCRNPGRWSYNGNGTAVRLKSGETELCLNLEGEGLPPRLSTECDGGRSLWRVASGFQIVGVDEQGRSLCLEGGPVNSTAILAKDCLCIGDSDCSRNPQAQWFTFVTSNMA